MSNFAYKVSIGNNDYGSPASNLYFASKKEAKKAKDKLEKTKLAYEIKRPNDPEARRVTIKHDAGELTMNISNISELHLFHQDEARQADQKLEDEDVERKTKMYTEAFKNALEAMKGWK